MKRSLSDMKRETPREPFILTVNPVENGEKLEPVDVEFINPKKLHWTKLASLDDMSPAQAMATLIEDGAQFEAFGLDPDLDGEALEWVMSEWRTHFGLGEQGNSAGSTGS